MDSNYYGNSHDTYDVHGRPIEPDDDPPVEFPAAEETWWEGKAFRRWGHFDPDIEPVEITQAFRGENAEADARAWFGQTRDFGGPAIDSVYVYRHQGASKSLVLSHADTYPWEGDDDDDEYDYDYAN